MKSISKDPLLTFARWGTVAAQIFLIFVQVVLGIAMAATAIAALGFVPDGVDLEGIDALDNGVMAAAALAMALGLAALGLATRFVVRLRQIIDTVGQGDPFVAENAVRLTHMAWLTLVGQCLMILAGICGGWINAHSDGDNFDLEMGVSLSGFLLSIILFILARVFREGTRMRAELEGTV